LKSPSIEFIEFLKENFNDSKQDESFDLEHYFSSPEQSEEFKKFFWDTARVYAKVLYDDLKDGVGLYHGLMVSFIIGFLFHNWIEEMRDEWQVKSLLGSEGLIGD